MEAVESLDIEPFNPPNDNLGDLEYDQGNIDIIINNYKTHPTTIHKIVETFLIII